MEDNEKNLWIKEYLSKTKVFRLRFFVLKSVAKCMLPVVYLIIIVFIHF